MKLCSPAPSRAISRAYTLIEALVASSILLVGIAAAASMALSFVTQEEITERNAKAISYLENACALYQAGVDTNLIASLLPSEPVVTTLTFTNGSLNVTNLGAVPSTVISVTYHSSGATATSSPLKWTGGDKDTVRTISVEAIRASRYLDSPLPRVQHFQ